MFIKQTWQDAVHFTAQTGESVPTKTDVELTITPETVTVRFHCKDNPYLAFNQYHQDNEPLYNQEVFELFISGGENDSNQYLELEVNPNGA